MIDYGFLCRAFCLEVMALLNNCGFHTKDNLLLILSFPKIYIERYSSFVSFSCFFLKFKDWKTPLPVFKIFKNCKSWEIWIEWKPWKIKEKLIAFHYYIYNFCFQIIYLYLHILCTIHHIALLFTSKGW